MKTPFVFIHGYNGQGKSTLAHTLPGPTLSLDFEGRSSIIRGKNTLSWEEFTNPEGVLELAEDSVVYVHLEGLADFDEKVALLKSGDHPFESVVIDSMLILQEEIKLSINGDPEKSNGEFAFWEKVFGKMMSRMKTLQKLTYDTASNQISIAVVCPTNRDDDKPKRPDLEGKTCRRVIGLFDLVGASVKVKQDGEYRFRLEIDLDDYETDEFEVKCDIDAVTEKLVAEEAEIHVIWDPNLTDDVYTPMIESEQ